MSIPYGRQEISQADIEAVVKVLRSDFLTQGPVVPTFEDAVAKYCGAQHAIAVNSGTSALHIACLALGVGPGDIVWTSPITFVASANCARYCGADVDFVDIDPHSYNISTGQLAKKLARAKALGRLPKVVIPVHLAGQPCEMVSIKALADEYGFCIIEDAAHALGSYYRGKPIGDSTYSDITIFSFHPVKIITTGEGGMALTNDTEIAHRLARLRTHGITRDVAQMSHAPDGPWYYEQIDLGFNYRMTDIQAALGLSQLQRIDEFVARRHALAKRYGDGLADMPITSPWQHPDGYSALHLYIIRLNLDEINKNHRQVFEELHAVGIHVNLHYIPVHLHPYYERQQYKIGSYPEAERYYSEAISLPMYPGLTLEDQNFVIDSLRRILKS